MKRIFAWAALGIALGFAQLVWADPFDQVNSNASTDVGSSSVKGVAVSDSIENYNARADGKGAAAADGSFAYVDNSVFLHDSVLSNNEMKGTISGNAVLMENGSDFTAVNKINDFAFKDAKGVSQVSQIGGQNNLIQQNFTVQGNAQVDRRSP